MTDMKEHWLSIAVIIYLVAMVLYGHWKGFIRMSVSALALIVALGASHAISPRVSSYLSSSNTVTNIVEHQIRDALSLPEEEPENAAEQKEILNEISMPDFLRSELVKNNSKAMYEKLGAETFTGYISGFLTRRLIEVFSFLGVFLAIFLTLRLFLMFLNVVTQLPVIHGLNQIAGALLGGIEGVILLWAGCLLLMMFAGTSVGKMLLDQIQDSSFLSFFYKNNMLSVFVLNAVRGLI